MWNLRNVLYRKYFRVFIAIAMSALSGCGLNRSLPDIEKPNIVIILADDLGYGDVSIYGQEIHRTANIHRLAESGVKCTDFYVPVPYCAPSRATLLTGRFPLRHGLVKNPAPDAIVEVDTIGIAASELLLGEVLQDEGYHTKLIGKWHLGHHERFFPLKHGFDEYYGILYSNDMRPVQLIENMDTVMWPVEQSLLTQQYTEKAIEFIDRNKDDRFFLQLAHAMPHKPLAASKDFYSPETPDDLYDDVIRELDWSTGAIVEALKRNGILENTILIFMSDNGPWYGGNTGGLKGMKGTDWEGGTRVPFVIRYPKALPKGKTVNTACWSPDLFPTLLSLAGIALPEDVILDGKDITDILQGKATSHDPVFTMHNNTVMTIREGEWKLYVNKPRYHLERDLTNWKDPRGPDGATILAPLEQYRPDDYPGVKPEKFKDDSALLFNLREDVAEMNNVSEKHPEIKERLLEKYNDFMETFK